MAPVCTIWHVSVQSNLVSTSSDCVCIHVCCMCFSPLCASWHVCVFVCVCGIVICAYTQNVISLLICLCVSRGIPMCIILVWVCTFVVCVSMYSLLCVFASTGRFLCVSDLYGSVSVWAFSVLWCVYITCMSVFFCYECCLFWAFCGMIALMTCVSTCLYVWVQAFLLMSACLRVCLH